MNSHDRAILDKMLSEIVELEGFVAGVSSDNFLKNAMMKKAVCMTLLIIGELAQSLSEEFVAAQSSTPWRKIMRFRDIVAHRYQSLDMMLVFTSATVDATDLRAQIELILLNDQHQ